MQSHDVKAALKDLQELKVTANTTEADAITAFRALGTLNQCQLGVIRFSGLSPWERHPDADELLHLLEGAVDVTVLTDDGPVVAHVPAGSVFVVPRGLWHRQSARPGTALLFVTGETEVSWAGDPRVAE
jgi:quercetin dioxygenase-like cupin family protein